MRHGLFKRIIKSKFKKIWITIAKQTPLFMKEGENKDNLYNMQKLCDMTVVINGKNIDKVVSLLIAARSIIIADEPFFEVCNAHCKNLQNYGIDICCFDTDFNDYKSYRNGTVMILNESINRAKKDSILLNIKEYSINPVIIRKFEEDKENNLLDLFFLNTEDIHINLCIEALFNCITMGVISRKINKFGEMFD